MAVEINVIGRNLTKIGSAPFGIGLLKNNDQSASKLGLIRANLPEMANSVAVDLYFVDTAYALGHMPNAKLTDDEERANDARIGTRG